MGDLGLVTHESLSIFCDNLGVQPPTAAEFLAVFPVVPQVNSAAEGIVVLEPGPEADGPSSDPIAATPEVPTATHEKKPRRRKEAPTES